MIASPACPRQRSLLHGQDHDGFRRCEGGRRGHGQGGGIDGGSLTVSIPAISRAADQNDLNPIICRTRRLTARWSCPTTLLRYVNWRSSIATPLSVIRLRTAAALAPLLSIVMVSGRRDGRSRARRIGARPPRRDGRSRENPPSDRACRQRGTATSTSRLPAHRFHRPARDLPTDCFRRRNTAASTGSIFSAQR